MPKVSVIIPVYNGERFLKETIESVLAQTYKDYEIIVVDDGSTDKSKEVLQPYIDKGLVRYFYQENQGAANARSRAIKEARGKYIAWLDQDDVWLPNRLKNTVNILERHKDVVVVGSWFLDIDEENRPLDCNWFLKPGIVNNILKNSNAVPSSSALIRRSVIVENNEFLDQSFWPRDDYHLWVRLAKYGKIVIIPKILYLYRLHSQQNIRKFKHVKSVPEELLNQIRSYPINPVPQLVWLIYWRISKCVVHMKLEFKDKRYRWSL